MRIIRPVIRDAAGEARNTTAPATSIGSPMRCKPAICSITSARNFGSASASSVPGVVINVGATAFTVMLYLPHSIARHLVTCEIPALVMQYTDSAGNATNPAWELKFTMRPAFCRIITRPAAWLAKKVPFRLTASVRSKSSSRASSARLLGPKPALLTRISSRPKRATVSSTAREIWSRCSTSICNGNASRPVFSISRARLLPVFTSRNPRATLAPAFASASEMARPRPRAAPVTSATWPVSSNRGNPFMNTPRSVNSPSLPRSGATSLYQFALLRRGGTESETAGLANSQFRLQFPNDALAALPANPLQQQFRGLIAQLIFWQFHRGQLGPKDTQPGIIIEADESEVFRASQPHLFGRFKQSNGHQVIRDVDAVGPVRQEQMSSAVTRFDSVVAFDHQFRLTSQSTSRQSVLESLPPRLAVADFHRAAHQPDPAAPGSRQVADGFIRSLIVVGDHRILRHFGRGAHDQHDRNVHFLDHLL